MAKTDAEKQKEYRDRLRNKTILERHGFDDLARQFKGEVAALESAVATVQAQADDLNLRMRAALRERPDGAEKDQAMASLAKGRRLTIGSV